MPHFVSASAGHPCSMCGARSTHKVGEEIPSDEPCSQCGKPYQYDSWSTEIEAEVELDRAGLPKCSNFSHYILGPARHNLTAYVCCACFTKILGPATGCPT